MITEHRREEQVSMTLGSLWLSTMKTRAVPSQASWQLMLTWRDYVFFPLFFFYAAREGPPTSRRQGRLASGSVAYLGRVYTPRTPPLQPENKPPTLPSQPASQPASRQTGEKPVSQWQHGLVSLGRRQPHSDFFSLRRFTCRKGPCIAQEQEQEQGSPTAASSAADAASLPASLGPDTPPFYSSRRLGRSQILVIISPTCPPTPPNRRRSSNGGNPGEKGKQPRKSGGKINKKYTTRVRSEELRVVQSEAGSGFTTWICQVTWLVGVCVSLDEDQSDSTSLIPAIKRLGEGTTGSGDTIINLRNCVQTLFYIFLLLFAPEVLTAKTCCEFTPLRLLHFWHETTWCPPKKDRGWCHRKNTAVGFLQYTEED